MMGLLTLVVLALPLPLPQLQSLVRRAVSSVLTPRSCCRQRLSALTLGRGLKPQWPTLIGLPVAVRWPVHDWCLGHVTGFIKKASRASQLSSLATRLFGGCA